MSLTVDDVQQILEAAIVEAKLGGPDKAPMLATALAATVTTGLNEVLGTSSPQQLTVESGTPPLMSVAGALLVRDAVSTVIAKALAVGSGNAPKAAESLLVAGYIDVPAVLAADGEPVELKPVTGSHATVTGGPYSS